MRRLINRGKIVSASLMASLSPALMAQGFWEDSHGRLTLRNFYFNDGYRDGGEEDGGRFLKETTQAPTSAAPL